MKTRQIILLLSIIGLNCEVSAQVYSKDSIDSIIKLYYPTSNFKINTLYILDGIPLDSNQIDSVLTRDTIEIVKYSFLDYRKSITWERQSNVVLLVSKSAWPRKTIKKDYNAVFKRLKKAQNNVLKSPVLLINSQLIESKYSYKRTQEIPLNNIYSINVFLDSVSIEKFGINGKNGLIEIKTKEKKQY
jgi:hypothetical protein